MTSYLTTHNKFIGQFAYLELGTDHDGLPLIMLTHLSATLDDWDPLFIDQLAGQNHVIAVDLPGVGASRGQVPPTIEQMASQVIEFVQLLDFSKINLLGLSMGGMIAQAVAEKKPELINRLVLAGTGPRGGQGIAQVSTITFTTMSQPPSAKVDGLWANTPVLSIRTTICIDTDDLLEQPQLLEQ